MNANVKKSVSIVAILSFVAGAVLIVAGGVVWGMISSQLKAEEITISADADMLAGKKVAGPFTAFAQAEVINKHALKGSEGQTYAQLGAKVNEFKAAAKAADTTKSEDIAAAVDKMDIAKLTELGASADVVSNTEAAAKAQGQRNTVMNGSFLRASLFTSVVAYGVSALVMGLGVMMLAIGFAFNRIASVPAPAVISSKE
ncbi:hypothetical protein [Sanguibacter sp. HDW7]|uniref:hypothetical protein n=1 Tax=Sanguibacter sp. HDW7 TaxID=2714931 RepID=UPI001F0EA1B6|nr:hypothetical protein [Sanguibacter sp. HDW7]